MKYYLHDTNSFNDEKITLLFQKYGYEGLGLFYTFLEKIASQEQPINTDALKFQLKVGKKLTKCWNFMESIGLLSSNNGETFNKQLLNFSEKFEIKKEKNRNRVAQWRENQKSKESVTHYESVRNAPKVKESKVNRNKEKKKNKHPFSESDIFDKVKFSEMLASSPKPYCNADPNHYYESAKNGSDSKGYLYLDWLAAIKNWIRRDDAEGKMKRISNPENKITPSMLQNITGII